MYFEPELSDRDSDSDSESSHSSIHSLTLLKMYSRPDEELLQKSSRALYVCHLEHEDDKFMVVPLMQIQAVVGMVSFNPLGGQCHADGAEYFVVEKMGHSNKYYEDDDGNVNIESDSESDADGD